MRNIQFYNSLLYIVLSVKLKFCLTADYLLKLAYYFYTVNYTEKNGDVLRYSMNTFLTVALNSICKQLC